MATTTQPHSPPTSPSGMQLTNGITKKSQNSTASTRIQVVNEEKSFTHDLSQRIDEWGLGQAGFGYDVVAVFGSQSTGKSTLLNRLFGTTFDVMDESRRQQTTKGIWMCRARDANLMVMDVEGTDGRERGEDQDFERKSALFSLASSEVLIVNLWEHQVGLYQGANMGLLKTVFEVNLSLFGKMNIDGSNQRTLLMFVIRDHVGSTPLSNLEATLTADMHKIWDALSKPTDLADRKLSDYFDLVFTTLPHKVLMPEKFESEVVELRKRFVDSTRDDYVFKPMYHKRIPADGVAHYMEGVWDQVQSNKDLDLPTQQELLAQFRCDEIATVALDAFNIQARTLRKPIEAGNVVEQLGKHMSDWKTQAMTRFDRDASRYHRGVYQRKRADLLTQIHTTLHLLFLGQLKNLHKIALSTFKQKVKEGVSREGYDFGEVVKSAKEQSKSFFLAGAQEALVAETDWSFEEDQEQLTQEISTVGDQMRADETKKMVNHIERSFKKQISEPVVLYLSKAAPTMWDEVLTVFKDTLTKAETTYLTRAKSFNCTDEENEQSLTTLRRRAWQALRAKIDEQTSDAAILTKLRSHFEESFRYDVQGVPRVWKPDDDIDGAFRKARDETLTLLPLYSSIAPKDPSNEFSLPSDTDDGALSGEGEFDFASTLVIFSETKQLELSTKFRRDADAYYVEAKRSMVSSIAQIPLWMYGVLVVLGWNEAMAVLFNPLYFALLIGAAISAWVIWQLNLSGPLLAVGKTIAGEVQNQASTRLREHFSEPQMTQPVAARRKSYDEDDDEHERRRRRHRKSGSPIERKVM